MPTPCRSVRTRTPHAPRCSPAASATRSTSDTVIPADQWTHLAATYDGTNLKIYVDGKLERSIPVSGATDITDVFLGLGVHRQLTPTNEGPMGFFDGALDTMQVHGRALSDAEIAALAAVNVPSPPVIGSPIITTM